MSPHVSMYAESDLGWDSLQAWQAQENLGSCYSLVNFTFTPGSQPGLIPDTSSLTRSAHSQSLTSLPQVTSLGKASSVARAGRVSSQSVTGVTCIPGLIHTGSRISVMPLVLFDVISSSWPNLSVLSVSEFLSKFSHLRCLQSSEHWAGQAQVTLHSALI